MKNENEIKNKMEKTNSCIQQPQHDKTSFFNSMENWIRKA